MTITERSQTKTLKKAKRELSNILSTMEKYKNCYFWKNTGNASYRRGQEFTESHSLTIFKDDLTIELDLRISCNNFYFTKEITVNDKKSNATKLKGYIKKIDAILEKRGV